MFKLKNAKDRSTLGQAALGYVLALATVAIGMGVILNSAELRQGIAEFYTDAAHRVIHSGKIGEADLLASKEETWGSPPTSGSPEGVPQAMPPSPPKTPGSVPGETSTSTPPILESPMPGGGMGPGGPGSGGTQPGSTGTGPSSPTPGTTAGGPPAGPDLPPLDPQSTEENMSKVLPNEAAEPAQCEVEGST